MPILDTKSDAIPESILWADVPERNERIYVHLGCDEPLRLWVVPLDDAPAPSEPEHECARCAHVVPLKAGIVSFPTVVRVEDPARLGRHVEVRRGAGVRRYTAAATVREVIRGPVEELLQRGRLGVVDLSAEEIIGPIVDAMERAGFFNQPAGQVRRNARSADG